MAESLEIGHDGAASRLAALRDRIPLLREVAYFQTGSLAPLITGVRDAMVFALETEGTTALAGPGAYSAFHQQAEQHRSRLAAFLGAGPAEIGWATNTTTALRYAIDSLDWHPGDTLITTNREHISTRSLQRGLEDRRSVGTSSIEASGGDDRFLSELERCLSTERSPRLVLMSHVSCQDGRRLPVAEAARLAHDRGIPVLVDGAQSLGQFPIDLREIDCDMLVGSAHKWLLGPAGLGFLYVADRGLAPFSPPFAMAPLDQARSCSGTGRGPVAAGMELGTAGMAAQAGLAAALDEIDRIGLPYLQHHVARLTGQLRAELQTLPGISLLSPAEPALGCGIVGFTIAGSDHARLTSIVAALWESDRVVAKVQVEHPSIRVSIAAFNTEDDVCRLTRALGVALSARPS